MKIHLFTSISHILVLFLSGGGGGWRIRAIKNYKSKNVSVLLKFALKKNTLKFSHRKNVHDRNKGELTWPQFLCLHKKKNVEWNHHRSADVSQSRISLTISVSQVVRSRHCLTQAPPARVLTQTSGTFSPLPGCTVL